MSTGRPVSALRVAATPVSTDSAPARAPARWLSGIVGLGDEEAAVQQRVAAEMAARPVLDPIRSTERSVPSTQDLVASVRRLEGLLLVHPDLDPALGAVEGEVIALDRHDRR